MPPAASTARARCLAAAWLLAGRAEGIRDSLDVEVHAREGAELPTGQGAWRGRPGEATRKVAYEEIGRCFDPDQTWNASSEGPAEWEEPLKHAVEALRGRELESHAQGLRRPINRYSVKYGEALSANLLPLHYAAGLTSDRSEGVVQGQFRADSRCFLFDYDGFKDGDKDPHGCNFFRRSFQPLKKLRQCIVSKLDNDRIWIEYKERVRIIADSRRDNSMTVENPSALTEEEKAAIAAFSQSNSFDAVFMAYDSIARADEMVKMVSFKEWKDDMTFRDLVEMVEKKISHTIVTTDGSNPLLTSDTVKEIRRECFNVPDVAGDAHVTIEVYKEPRFETLKRALALKRAMPCYQLMWDTVEVPGAPEPPMSNALTMFWKSLESHTLRVENFDTPPVCARGAVALVAEKMKRATYSSYSCLVRKPSWGDCLHPTTYNCICFERCWEKALKRMCEIEPGCCWSGRQRRAAEELPRDRSPPAQPV